MANVTEEDLEKKRREIANLHEEIAKESSKQSAVVAAAARVQEARQLDAEINRLKSELEERRVTTEHLTDTTSISARSAVRQATAAAQAAADADTTKEG